MELGLSLGFGRREEEEDEVEEEEERSSGEPPLQLSLLPSVPLLRHPSSSSSQLGFPWPTGNNNAESSVRGFDVNRIPSAEEAEQGSPNSTVSSFPMDFSTIGIGRMPSSAVVRARSDGEPEPEPERASSRASDDEENGSARKKLRLSKDQSAFLEESFKEHNTLNPKQKLALAKQLNLRPRQVEVWFQNRRARTKLKQTEVDCEYLKRCCETLTEENRRLQKELTELRALKTPSNPFFMQLPATTLSMCPSCERTTTTTNGSTPVAVSNSDGRNNSSSSNKSNNSFASLFGKQPRFFPFVPHPATSPAS